MRHWRKMTWLIHVTNAIFVIWVIGGIEQAVAAPADNTAVGALGVIVVLWFMVFIVEALVWFMTKPKEKPQFEWQR